MVQPADDIGQGATQVGANQLELWILIEQAGHLPEEVKQARRDALMELQQSISLARNQALVGKTLRAGNESR